MMSSQSCLTAYNWLRRHLGEMVDCRFAFFGWNVKQLPKASMSGPDWPQYRIA
jgi:hypothetical protein